LKEKDEKSLRKEWQIPFPHKTTQELDLNKKEAHNEAMFPFDPCSGPQQAG
jgi:hypothetical protein